MKILLVMPHLRNKIKFPQLMVPPFPLQQLAGITPNEHSVTILDERYQKLRINNDYDLVGIYCITYLAKRAYEIGDKFREIGVKTVLGGDHASALPDEAKQHADSVVIDESEQTWPKLLDDLKNNNLQPFYRQEIPIDGSLIPPAKRINNRFSSFIGSIQSSRGCPVGCEFCAVSNRVHGKIFRGRPIENVIEEIKSIKQKNLFFHNPTSTANVQYTKDLFRAMVGLNKKFMCYGNVNALVKDDELLKLASEAGLTVWNVGLESISQDTINSMGKRTNKVDDYKRAVKKIHDYNTRILGNFVFGFDNDKPDVFDKTLETALDIDLDLSQFAILTPFPGTPLFERLNREGRILTKDWSRYTEADVVFQPKNVTIDQLKNGTMNCLSEFYSAKNVYERFIKNKGVPLISSWKLSLDNKVYFKNRGMPTKSLKIY